LKSTHSPAHTSGANHLTTTTSRTESLAPARTPRRRGGRARPTDLIVPGKDEFLMAVLGGCDSIGMNMTMYGSDGKWLIVDAGCTFPDDDEADAGIEVIVPDPEFALRHADLIVGLVITHAHEDHVGAIAHLWPRLNCPIYATPFAAEAIRAKLDERRLSAKVRLHTHRPASSFRVGPFALRSVPAAHSIPEATMLAITTGAGTLLHTGDWKIDPNPVVGAKTDLAALEAIGNAGVLAMMADSTNAMTMGATPSEGTVQAGLESVFAGRTGAITVACFSSNIARLKSVALAAKRHGRKVALAGRSLVKMEGFARKIGLLAGVPEFLSDAEILRLPRRERVVMCTGTQGEEKAALSRIAHAEHRRLRIEEGDLVVFSSRCIPGNEEGVADIQKRLRLLGAEIVTPADAPVHVSGHPARDDLARMMRTVRPQACIPVHGTPAHLAAHRELAQSLGFAAPGAVYNGALLRITSAGVEQLADIESGLLAWNGARLRPYSGAVADDAAELALHLADHTHGFAGLDRPAPPALPRVAASGRPLLSLARPLAPPPAAGRLGPRPPETGAPRRPDRPAADPHAVGARPILARIAAAPAPDHDATAPGRLSTSARRRLQRKRAKERHLEAAAGASA